MFNTMRVVIAEAAVLLAWGTARVGVMTLPKNHPLRRYHEFSRKEVLPVYRKACRRIR